MKDLLYILILLLLGSSLCAQETNKIDKIIFDKDTTIIVNEKVLYQEPEIEKVNLKGKVYSAMIIEGDTIILADIEDISITSLRKFSNDEEYRKYLKMRRYANKVYPYAKEAIRIFEELEFAKQTMKRRKFKKEAKRLEKELEIEFEEPLSKLTKLQGKILVKMIEKETGKTFHSLIKQMRGRFTAFAWHNMGKLYSYDLKEGYQYGQYKILDAVLQDFDISYSLDKEDLKYVKKKK